jgi:hypothetical protein
MVVKTIVVRKSVAARFVGSSPTIRTNSQTIKNMPLPKPESKEKKSDFISRCMSEIADDLKFPDPKQRTAICSKQFEEAKASAEVSVASGDDEFLIFRQP